MRQDFEAVVHRISRGVVEELASQRIDELEAAFLPTFEAAYDRLPSRSVVVDSADDSVGFDSSMLETSVVGLTVSAAVQFVRLAEAWRERGRSLERLVEADLFPDGATAEQRRIIEAVLRRTAWETEAAVELEAFGPVHALQLFVRRHGPPEAPRLEFRLHGVKGEYPYCNFPCGERHLARAPEASLRETFVELAALRTESEGGCAEALVRLRNLGANLFETFVPDELERELRRLVPLGGDLLVLSDDPWIPWELLKLPARDGEPSPFLAEAFELARWSSERHPVRRLPIRRMAVLAPGVDDGGRAEEERTGLLGRGIPGRRQVEEVEARYLAVVEGLSNGPFDAWHFIGHGRRAAGGPEHWEISLRDKVLRVSDLSDEVAAGIARSRPFVFLNACHAGGAASGLVRADGWPHTFTRAGAAAFLGPLWAVDSHRAADFAELFYERFFAGAPIARAAWEARLALRERFPGDPTWLAYSLYADPGARVHPLPATGEARPVDSPPPRRDRSWSDKREQKILAGRLSATSGAEYQSLVLRLLRPALGEWEGEQVARGGELWTVGEEPPHAAAVAILHFDAPGERLGTAEVAEALRAVERARPIAAGSERFVLVHNRHGGSARFREEVEVALETLVVAEGFAETRAELWDYQQLLRHAFNGMLELLLSQTARRGLSLATVHELLHPGNGLEAPLEQVQVRTSTLVADQFRLRREEEVEERVLDPGRRATAGAERSVTLLLGGFGYGKTTALARALALQEREIFYVPAAALSEEIHGSKDLLVRCLDLDALLAEVPEEDLDDYRLLARPVVEYVFKQGEVDAVLVLDGLDESPFLHRAGGLQNLFNNLWDLRTPVVLSMRSEFWDARRQDFEASFGDLPGHGERRVRRISKLELLPWRNEEVVAFLERLEATWEDERGRPRLRALRDWVGSGRFEEVYGDVPRRPLFLRLIAETVAARDLPADRVGRAQLFAEAVEIKIRRDVVQPVRAGGPGRPSILGEPISLAHTIELAWRAMIAAAAGMTQEIDGAVELLPDCPYEAVRDSVAELHDVDEPLTLFLHSLLHLSHPRTGRHPRRIRFAHRAFQEYFLAWHLLEQAGPAEASYPDSVLEWVEDLRAEGLVSG